MGISQFRSIPPFLYREMTKSARVSRFLDSVPRQQGIPRHPLAGYIRDQFNDEKNCDVEFNVTEACLNNQEGKKVKASTRFFAHRFILKLYTEHLASLCEENSSDVNKPIPIDDVSPDVFHDLLLYMYGGCHFKDKGALSYLKARELIEAADRYGVVNLKLEVEASFVLYTTFTVGNINELFDYAVSKNCHLLKEAALDYIVRKCAKTRNIQFANVSPQDLLTAMSLGVGRERLVEVDLMYISKLRQLAVKMRLDRYVDGSRDVLIGAIKNRQAEEEEEEEEEEEGEEGGEEEEEGEEGEEAGLTLEAEVHEEVRRMDPRLGQPWIH